MKDIRNNAHNPNWLPKSTTNGTKLILISPTASINPDA